MKIEDRSDVEIFTCSFNSMEESLNSNWERDFPDFEIKVEVLFKAEVYKKLDEHPSHIAIKRLKKALGSALLKSLVSGSCMGFETVEEAKQHRDPYGNLNLELSLGKERKEPDLKYQSLSTKRLNYSGEF